MPELPLKEGDRIKVGNHLFRFSMMDDLEIDAAVAFAEAGHWEQIEDLERFVLMDEVPE